MKSPIHNRDGAKPEPSAKPEPWDAKPPISARSLWMKLYPLAVFIAVLVVGNLAAGWLTSNVDIEITPGQKGLLQTSVILAAAAYAILLAVPFVPGVEIALALLMVVGSKIAVLIYLCTLVGLMISFLVGRFMPLGVLIGGFKALRLSRAQALLETIKPMEPNERLEFLMSNAPNRFIPFLLKNRHLAVAIVLNIPGNSLIGGGGGISLLAGISRLYSVPAFLLTIAIAVAPVPLAALVFGVEFLSG